jgi:hypothetical protein
LFGKEEIIENWKTEKVLENWRASLEKRRTKNVRKIDKFIKN